MSAPHLTVSSTRLADLLHPWTTATQSAARSGPAYRTLADRIRALLLDGRIPLTARLPAERGLADRLGISRTTVAAAYELLRTDGYLTSRRGSGSWTTLPGTHTEIPTRGLSPSTTTGVIDLGVAALPGPGRALHQAVADATDSLPTYTTGHGYLPGGLPVLRDTLAQRYTRRGVPTTPDQILVTPGALAAVTLVLRTLAGPGDRVAVESPTYANVLDAIRQAGNRPVPVPMTDTGWDVETWRDTLRTAAPRLAYLIPDYQNPTGHLADPGIRRTLADLARNTGTTLIIDETCHDLALDLDPADRPLPMAAFDRTNNVITIGSTSKTFWGGLRIGWIRATPDLVRRIAATRASFDVGAPVLDQLVTHHLITDHEDAILETRLPALRAARGALADALTEHLPDWTFSMPLGGLSLWVRTDGTSSLTLAETAARHGVRVAAGTHFGTDGTFEHHVRLPYAHDPATLTEAIRRLSAAVAETERTRPTTYAGFSGAAVMA
ncbi:MocR-like transcription factor YczR [Embleya hyalina]|uniref:GntR family transcriptional regulator n=1 Tax=Embleya hyalina TaxID=516124 RepID=A0A401YU98_9ACTN|nr:PLP-dependent aminotransferase family protein [Embleya hyalina]GCD98180.1 GntR family transcriptional regulator [Embleya hyalina]